MTINESDRDFCGKKNSRRKNKSEEVERDDHIVRTGIVTDVLKGNFKVLFSDTNEILVCRISGKLRQNKIRVLLGDRVLVKFSVYDTSNNGMIFKRG